MTAPWDLLVELLQAGIFGFAHLLGGSLPGGILATTVLVRVGLLPLTVRLARRARVRARLLASLRPSLRSLRSRHADDPETLARRTLELYRSRGVPHFDPAAVAGSLVQLPLLAGFFRAIREVLPALDGRSFLWIRDLARPSPLLALLTSSLVLLASTLGSGGAGSEPGWLRWLPAGASLAALLCMSSGFGLYLLASSGVSVLQAALVAADAGAGDDDGV